MHYQVRQTAQQCRQHLKQETAASSNIRSAKPSAGTQPRAASPAPGAALLARGTTLHEQSVVKAVRPHSLLVQGSMTATTQEPFTAPLRAHRPANAAPPPPTHRHWHLRRARGECKKKLISQNHKKRILFLREVHLWSGKGWDDLPTAGGPRHCERSSPLHEELVERGR